MSASADLAPVDVELGCLMVYETLTERHEGAVSIGPAYESSRARIGPRPGLPGGNSQLCASS
jgi:hypothetical protein